MITDANQRGTIVNRRRRELPAVHAQYDQIDSRFLRRCEALELDKAPVMDSRAGWRNERNRRLGANEQLREIKLGNLRNRFSAMVLQ